MHELPLGGRDVVTPGSDTVGGNGGEEDNTMTLSSAATTAGLETSEESLPPQELVSVREMLGALGMGRGKV